MALRHQLFVKAHSLVIFIVRHYWICWNSFGGQSYVNLQVVVVAREKNSWFCAAQSKQTSGDGPGSDGADRSAFFSWYGSIDCLPV